MATKSALQRSRSSLGARSSLNSSFLGKINCVNTFFAEGWNQHEKFEGKLPIRGYGEVVGWGNSDCEAPTEIAAQEVAHKKEIEEGKIEVPITVTATAEMPLEKISKQAEVCKVETKKIAQCNAKNGSEYTERETKVLTSEFHRRVTSLPWKIELIRGEREGETEQVLEKIGLHAFGESGTAVGHSTACFPKEGEKDASFKVLPAGCIGVNIVFPQIPTEYVFYGSQEIWGINGVKNGLFPSQLRFIEAGTLFSSEGLEGEGSTTGEVKIDGAKSPGTDDGEVARVGRPAGSSYPRGRGLSGCLALVVSLALVERLRLERQADGYGTRHQRHADNGIRSQRAFPRLDLAAAAAGTGVDTRCEPRPPPQRPLRHALQLQGRQYLAATGMGRNVAKSQGSRGARPHADVGPPQNQLDRRRHQPQPHQDRRGRSAT